MRLRAPPVEGKANAALVAFLAETTAIPRARWEILAGETGREKRLLARGALAATVRDILLPIP